MLNKQSIKTVIAINIAILLLTIVILIDFVFVSTGQKDHIDKKIKDHHLLVLSLENILRSGKTEERLWPFPSMEQYLREIIKTTDIMRIVIVDPNGPLLSIGNNDDERLRDILVNGASQALFSGENNTYLYGSTWGVFFIRNHYLILSSPIRVEDTVMPAAVCSVVDLAPFYSLQRKNQLVIFGYTLINILILAVLGTYAIGRITIRPINSLVKRAEEHQEHDSLGFFYPLGKNEFRRLSNSLNSMLNRIDGDKRRLETSLAGLEQANREIINRQNELIRAEKLASVGRLSAGIAHEIGNPIGIVLGYLDMLSRQNLTETEKKDYISRCQNEIQKINTIIRELLDFSRPSKKRTAELVAVHALLKETMDLLSVQPVMRNIQKKLELNASVDNVYAVPDKLRQVFVNLILNAADALSARATGDGQITIRTITATDEDTGAKIMSIDISDNGTGISETDLATIFDPFYTTKDPGRGTGLGLYVCYMIITDLGGGINAASRQGEGTTITVRIPLSDNDLQITRA